MTQEDIFGKVAEVLEEALGCDEDEITPTASLTADLGAESIDFLEISFRMEESFGFPFPTDDLGNIMNSVNENSTTEDVTTALDTLATLPMTRALLKATGAGKVVNKLARGSCNLQKSTESTEPTEDRGHTRSEAINA